ncbi:MAG: iron ABC transporter permease [Phycisphaerae bacterium]|nr:iron ABC transporter permease [Phycisphaerae bacterium]
MIPRLFTARRYVLSILAWVGVWVGVATVSVVVGGKLWTWDSPAQLRNVLALRLEWVATAGVVGAALALAGLAFQALLRNPLADPYVLGVSGGAGLGFILASLFLSSLLAPAFGFLGALVTVGLVYAIAQRRGRLEPYTLLLTGVVANVFYGAAIMLVTALARPAERGDIALWMMGNIGAFGPQWVLIGVMAALVAAVGVLYAFLAKGFNLVAAGEETAGSLGVRVGRLRMTTFVSASLLTGAAVALAGPIGFVGLIVPHGLRIVLGPDHRRLVPASVFLGATFLVLADLAACLWEGASDRSLPVGVLTAMCGGPFFVYLLRTRWRRAAEVQ